MGEEQRADKSSSLSPLSSRSVVSVAEHVVMSILLLVRNYNVGHEQISQNKEG